MEEQPPKKKMSARRWEVLADLLEFAIEDQPNLLSFRASRDLARVLGGLEDLERVVRLQKAREPDSKKRGIVIP